MEVQTDSIKPGQSVVIIDDLLATGGSLSLHNSLISHIENSQTASETAVKQAGKGTDLRLQVGASCMKI